MSQLAALLQPDPRAVAVARQLRAQQKIIGPKGLTIPEAYLDEFARAVVRWSGTGDIRSIKPEHQTVYLAESEATGPSQLDAWVYPFLAPNVEPLDTPGLLFALSADDKLSFWVRWIDEPGAVVFYAQPNVRESWWQPLVPLVAFAGAFIGLPALLGEAILGAEAAATYPLAAKTIGGVALQTALTGGDIEAAARSAAESLVGAQFGDVVGSGLDSAQIGKVAAAAATAAVQGGDIDKAVTRTLINIGAQSVDDYFDTTDYGTGDWDPSLMDYVTLDDIGVRLDLVEINDILSINSDTLDAADIDPSTLFPDEYGNLFLASGEFVELSDTVFVDSIYVDADGNVRAPDNNILVPSDEALNLTADQLSAEIARMMDEKAGTTTQTAPAPPTRPAATPPAASQTKWPSVTDATKMLDAIGKLSAQLKSTLNAVKTGTYKPPAGSTSTTGLPRNTPVGVPITLPDGRVIVNNGNGTQTIRNPDGTAVTVSSSYSGATGAGGGGLLPGVSNQALLIGGAILVGAVLLARRR